MRISRLALSMALLLGGCVTVQQREDAAVVATAGADAELQRKVERGHQLSLDEIAELSREGVPDAVLTRTVNRSPGGYALKTADIERLKKAGVGTEVIDTMLELDRRDADRYRNDDPYFYGPRGYYRHYGRYPFYGPIHFHRRHGYY